MNTITIEWICWTSQFTIPTLNMNFLNFYKLSQLQFISFQEIFVGNLAHTYFIQISYKFMQNYYSDG